MKVNNRQLLLISYDEPDFEGRLHFKKVSMHWTNDNKAFKERWFKLKHNMLFYFKMNDTHQIFKEPAGVFILENSDVFYEENGEVPFSFTIVFNYEPDVKYLFSARSENVVFDWISALKSASFGHLKEKLNDLQNKLSDKSQISQKGEKVLHKNHRLHERTLNISTINFALDHLNLNNEKTGHGKKTDKLFADESNKSRFSLTAYKTDNTSDVRDENNLILL